ncbi:lipopolysaccharide biosynthesis protein [Polluticoccus soli]|uniref:lipopolysaccharide biosynthesis protein n=1 Tax=Polluticoccus soli TaxID=3034150 RepID=UPI0023E21054|nr:polysaccharide biosynthesis C-terminal domain-containing protein [Flavipsychrobacter sp. JY13-12]
MASLKKLAGQTVWYGVSNIAVRLLTYLLTPYLTHVLTGPKGQVVFGQQGFLYSIFPVMNILYTYGMETAYFRFSTTEDKLKLYRTQLTSMLVSTLFFSALLWIFRVPAAEFAELGDRTEYVWWCAAIIGLDALSALPYARLRKENRPRKYAATKAIGIVVFVFTIVFLYSFGDNIAKSGGIFADWYNRHWGIGFILFANLLQAIVTLVLLAKELLDYRPYIDKAIIRKVLPYSLPILIAGFAGTFNDSLNRVMFQKLYPASSQESLRLLGFFTAALRLSILINLAIQAFRLAAEPFFFSISQEKNATGTYARVMKWFVIIMALMFLNVTLYIDIWKHFLSEEYRVAIGLVPVLLLSYIMFGIYTNLTVWYKLTDKTRFGTYIMIIGAVVTVVFNLALIPSWGYHACAWGMLLTNTVMVVLSYSWGQKYYPIPYNVGKLAAYLGVMLLLFFIQYGINSVTTNLAIRLSTGTALFLGYFFFIYTQERGELQRFPVIGKFIK